MKEFDLAFCLTVHNRIAFTSRIISQLLDIGLDSVIVITDDGCVDGTSNYLNNLKSDQLHIIPGNGDLYWAGGMRCATQYALKNFQLNYLIWVNDDISIYKNRFEFELNKLKSESADNKILVGGFEEFEGSGKLSYGLRTMKSNFAFNKKFDSRRNLMNGNLVIFPKTSFDLIYIDRFYRHGYADYDVGFRLGRNAFTLFSPKDWLGYCAPNARKQIWNNRQAPYKERFRDFFALNGLNFRDYCYYQVKNFRLTGLLRVLKAITELIL